MNPNMTSNLMLEPRMRIPNLEGGNSTVSLAPNSAPTSQLRSDAFPDLAPNPLPNAPPDLAPNSNVNRRLNSNPTPQNLTSPGMLTPPPTPPTDRLRTHQLIPNQASPHQPSIPRTHDQHPDEHPDEHPDQHPDEHPDEHPDQHPDQDPDQDPELPMETAVTPSPLPLMASPISASISSCGTKPSSLLNLALPRPTASHLSARNPRPLVLPPKTSRLRDFTEGLANSYAAAEPADAAKAAAKAEAAEAAAATPEGEHTAGRGVSPPPRLETTADAIVPPYAHPAPSPRTGGLPELALNRGGAKEALSTGGSELPSQREGGSNCGGAKEMQSTGGFEPPSWREGGSEPPPQLERGSEPPSQLEGGFEPLSQLVGGGVGNHLCEYGSYGGIAPGEGGEEGEAETPPPQFETLSQYARPIQSAQAKKRNLSLCSMFSHVTLPHFPHISAAYSSNVLSLCVKQASYAIATGTAYATATPCVGGGGGPAPPHPPMQQSLASHFSQPMQTATCAFDPNLFP